MLKASKVMRKIQSAEHSDLAEAGRRVDCLFMRNDVELSNIEFKSPKIGDRELTIQNRKNVRLARCIQESHLLLGEKDPSILMADVYGKSNLLWDGFYYIYLEYNEHTPVDRIFWSFLSGEAHG